MISFVGISLAICNDITKSLDSGETWWKNISLSPALCLLIAWHCQVLGHLQAQWWQSLVLNNYGTLTWRVNPLHVLPHWCLNKMINIFRSKANGWRSHRSPIAKMLVFSSWGVPQRLNSWIILYDPWSVKEQCWTESYLFFRWNREVLLRSTCAVVLMLWWSLWSQQWLQLPAVPGIGLGGTAITGTAGPEAVTRHGDHWCLDMGTAAR